MGVDSGADPGPGAVTSIDLAPFPVPERGLFEVLSAWTGEGSVDELFRTFGVIGAGGDDDLAERTWLEERVARERANRVLIGRLKELILRLPGSPRTWLNALPAETRSRRAESERPTGGVDWVRTARAGWPPATYHLKVRERTEESVLARLVRWTTDGLLPAIRDARKLTEALVKELEPHTASLEALAAHPTIRNASGNPPSLQEVRAVRAIGRPWSILAPITEELLRYTDLTTLVNELIVPEADLAWRLFHLGCFGEVLVALAEDGCDLTATAPLYGGSRSPSYIALVPDGTTLDVWFEASGCWRYYAKGVADPYKMASKSVSKAAELSPDILLVQRTSDGMPTRAFVVECKSGSNAAEAARDGYHQAVTYGSQFHSMTGLPVHSWVAGRDDLFGMPSAAPMTDGGLQSIGMVAGGSLGMVSQLWLDGAE